MVGVRCKRVYKRVLQARLMGELVLETCGRPRRVVDGRMTVEIQEPRGLLVASERSLIQFRELGIGIRCGHFFGF